jgi:hypothetical protein
MRVACGRFGSGSLAVTRLIKRIFGKSFYASSHSEYEHKLLYYYYYYYYYYYGPSPWSSGQNSWLQIQRSGFDFRRYQIF